MTTPTLPSPTLAQPPSLTQGSSVWLSEHLQRVQEKIVEQAGKLAERDNRTNIEPRDVAEAVKTFAPGIAVPGMAPEPLTGLSLIHAIVSWAPSITTVSALLAVVFGIIGWQAKDSSAFDIAKVFAGAIVGAAGATVKNKF